MLQIRQEQMDAFAAAARERFLCQLVDHCRTAWPQQTAEVPAPKLRAQLRRVVNRAAGHGITAEVDVVRFVNLTYVWGPAFDTAEPTAAWVRPVLEDDAMIGAVKIRKLRDRTRQLLQQREHGAASEANRE